MWNGQEARIRGAGPAGWSVVVEQVGEGGLLECGGGAVGEVGGGLMECDSGAVGEVGGGLMECGGVGL